MVWSPTRVSPSPCSALLTGGLARASRNTLTADGPLPGATANRGLVIRVGNSVHRPTAPCWPATHALLAHLKSVGFDGAPAPPRGGARLLRRGQRAMDTRKHVFRSVRDELRGGNPPPSERYGGPCRGAVGSRTCGRQRRPAEPSPVVVRSVVCSDSRACPRRICGQPGAAQACARSALGVGRLAHGRRAWPHTRNAHRGCRGHAKSGSGDHRGPARNRSTRSRVDRPGR